MAAVYEDTLNGCPTRSTNTASINDATSISTANPRPYRPGPLTPLDANSASSQPLNSTFDPWSDPLPLLLHSLHCNSLVQVQCCIVWSLKQCCLICTALIATSQCCSPAR